MPIRLAKNELRQKMRALRLALDLDEVARRSALAAGYLLALPELVSARRVAIYAAIAEARELDTAPIHHGLRERGVSVVYPRVRGRERPLELHAVDDRSELVVSAIGIPQPRPEAPIVDGDAIDAFVVPGLAFGEDGERVGWGAGHYDRLLGGLPAALRVGYAYDFQVVPNVPEGQGDQRMDLVVTDGGVRVRRPR